LESVGPDTFLADPGRPAVQRPGEISAEDIARTKAQLLSQLDALPAPDWLGELVTETREDLSPAPEWFEEQLAAIADTDEVYLQPGARLAWHEGPKAISVYVNGDSLLVDKSLLPLISSLCRDGKLGLDEGSFSINNNEVRILLEALLEHGAIDVEP
ncbi:MAG: hypothetical protein MK097_19865, partial [Dechloromonas sp.]|nr:hypothetical protein [Dechloromonas sp.]